MRVVATFPGKLGDAILQWPVMFHWAKQNGKQFEAWLDENSLKPLVPLLEKQPVCSGVQLKPGIVHYGCGGQPWHFSFKTSEFQDAQVFHMGFRFFPPRQITMESLAQSRVPLKLDQEALSETAYFENLDPLSKAKRLLLHGQGICTHNKQTPQFWKFIAGVRQDFERLFDEIVFVGSERDRAVGKATYPAWSEFDDQGDFYKLASYMNASSCVIGTGSSVVTLGGALKIPTIRVHDPIGALPKIVWSNLGKNQLNDSERDLRRSWPKFREEFLETKVMA